MARAESPKDRATLPCPCGSGRTYAACCAPLHAGAPAASAEALMRSRYSAYVFELEEYLLASWHPSTRPASLDLQNATPRIKWLGLEVKRHSSESPDAAIVDFVARCRIGGRAQRLHEISRFVREDGRWYYVAAENDSK